MVGDRLLGVKLKFGKQKAEMVITEAYASITGAYASITGAYASITEA